jgi:outer membrane protein assembly factor BamB
LCIGNVTIASSLSGTTTIPHGFPSTLILLLYCGKDKTLYCCDRDNNTLYGIKQDGTIMFSFSSGDFRRPIGVAAAGNGNLYVTAYKSNNLHCFTPDGKPKGIMLKKKDGLTAAATPIGLLKSPELKENIIVPSFFIP